MKIEDFGSKGEIFSYGMMNFDIEKLVKELNSGKYNYEIKEIKPFNPKESFIYIDDSKLPKEINYDKPIALFLTFKYKGSETNIIVDGNHRMYKAYKDGVDSVKILVIKDINLIKKIIYGYGKNFGKEIKKHITEDVERIPENILERLRKKFKLKKYCVGAQGCHGRIYELTNGNLLKVTTSPSESYIASKLVGKNLKHIANVYWVKKIKDEELWIYEVEKIKIPWKSEDILLYEEITGDWFEVDDWISQKENKKDKDKIKFFDEGLEKIKEEVKSLGIHERALDLHIFNLGIKNGELAIFDLDDAMRTKFDTEEIDL